MGLRALFRTMPAARSEQVEIATARAWLASTLFDVGPRKIIWRMRPSLHGYASQELPRSLVVGGPWDRLVVAYTPHPVVIEVMNRRISRTADAPDRPRLVLDRTRSRRYRTADDRERRRASIAALIDDVERRGFRPQPMSGVRSEDEIGVYLARDGGLIWGRQGDHRLSLAQLLDVPRVPVIVRGIHQDLWRRATRGGRPAVEGLTAVLAASGVRVVA